MYAVGASHYPSEGKGAGALTIYFQAVPPFDPGGERICNIPASIAFWGQKEHTRDTRKANLQPLEVKFTGLTKTEARAMEQILISAYTLDNLLNARREIAVGNVAGFTGRIDNVISIFEGVAEDELLNLMGR